MKVKFLMMAFVTVAFTLSGKKQEVTFLSVPP